MSKKFVFVLVVLVMIWAALFTTSYEEEDMSFSELMEKMGSGVPLTVAEQQTLLMEARRMEEVASLITSMIRPGTSNLEINELTVNNIHVNNDTMLLDQDGISTKAEGQETNDNAYKFIDDVGDTVGGTYGYFADADQLDFVALHTNGKRYYGYANLSSFNSFARAGLFANSPINANPTAMFAVHQSDTYSWADWNGTDFQLLHPATVPPATISAGNVYVYVKDSKYIIAYNDAGTARYKYLDLAGTGVTWVHTTVAP